MPPTPSPSHPDFRTAYLEGLLDEFFEFQPGDVAGALARPRTVDRARLCAALRRYAERTGAPAAVLRNVERLAHPQARAVVTGQQTGLLLGPTYTLSKAATAVRLAQQLDAPDRPVVPVFWLASQDHDAAEIDHTYLLDGSETLRRLSVALPDGVAAGRVPLARAMLDEVRHAVERQTPRPRFAEETLGVIEAAAADAATYVDWFAGILTRLMGEAGLVLVDPLQPDVATLFRDVLAREIAEPETTSEAVNEAGRRLKRMGYEPQLGRGAHATNLFLEVDGAELPRRVLLRHEGASFRVEGRALSAAEVLARLDDDPTAITPAAGLRPVVQDALLPTAVFVLGPGELRYVAQLREVYRFHQVAMPLAWPRAQATVLEPVAARLLDGLEVSAAAFRAAPDAVLERRLLERHGHAARFRQVTTTLEQSYRELLKEVRGIDVTLEGTVRNARRHLDMTLERLRDKTAGALRRDDDILKRQVERLAAHLIPLGQPAERVLSPFSHALKFGLTPLIDRFLAMEPEGEQELRL